MFDPRSILEMAVDDAAYAGDREVQYRLRESPAKGHIRNDAVDAGGILRGSIKTGIT
jgi:hypothetical protein